MKRRTIRIEIERSLTTHQPGRPEHEAIARCAECAGQVHMLRPEDAAAAARLSVRTIYRWVEAGRLHFIEAPEESLRICLNSLMRAPNN